MSKHAELVREWEREFGDHTECSVCGSQCRDVFVGNDLTPKQKAADEMYEALKRCVDLIGLITVRQVINAGDRAVKASGLNPWCINEGLAVGDERISTWWLDCAVANAEATNE